MIVNGTKDPVGGGANRCISDDLSSYVSLCDADEEDHARELAIADAVEEISEANGKASTQVALKWGPPKRCNPEAGWSKRVFGWPRKDQRWHLGLFGRQEEMSGKDKITW
jgi:hypothetical protein